MQCKKCGYEPTLAEIQAGQDECPGCLRQAAQKAAVKAPGKNNISPEVRRAQYDYAGAQPVVVVDFDMSFRTMVIFMVKWAFAAIPALIIVFFVSAGLLMFLGGFFGALSKP